MFKMVNGFICAIFVLTLLLGGAVSNAQVAVPATPFINEVKVRFDTTVTTVNNDEFIEIINPYETAINLNDFALEYFNTTNPTATQQPTQKPIGDGLLSPGSHLVLAKQPTQIPHSLQSPFSSLSDTGGRLRLVTVEGDIVDEVAWTNSSVLATASGVSPAIVYQCNSSTVLCTANRIQSLSRQLDVNNEFVAVTPLWILNTPTPETADLLPVPVEPTEPVGEDPPTEIPPTEPAPPVPTLTCEGVVITEVLPNPDGADGDKEFIEIYNSTTDIISMETCSLQISSSTKKYTFVAGSVLQPGEFVAVSDSVSGLTLPNAAGGTVWLLTPTTEIAAVTYPGDLEDDVSWALTNSTWAQTYKPTPSTENIAVPLKPCEIGQQRNVINNKCENIVVAAAVSLIPCKVGQERNPDTNRCRTTTTDKSSLAACSGGQQRNPATNRCRSVASTVSAVLKPCPEGQERNASTNRCRKVVGNDGATLAAVTDVKTEPIESSPKWWLAIAASTFAIGYAVFEWRQEISNGLRSLGSRIKR